MRFYVNILVITCLLSCKNKQSESIVSSEYNLEYHTDWAKGNYLKRIAIFKVDTIQSGDIVFLDNSLTENAKDWNKKLGTTNVRNRGIGGDVTDGVLQRLKDITDYKPSKISVLIGINDVFNKHEGRGIPSADYIAKNILKIVGTIHKDSPKTQIYLQTILPTDNAIQNKDVIAINNMIKAHNSNGMYQLIDLHKSFMDDAGLLRKELTYDGIHLNDDGYKIWISILKSYVIAP